MYDRTIPVMSHALRAMDAVLAKAEAHCSGQRIDPQALLRFRMYPDMLPFTRQIQIASDHARRCPARLTGTEPLAMEDTEASFPELRDRLGRTLDHIATFTPEQFEGSATRSIPLKLGGREITFTGSDYVGRFALPNFYFHLTTAYLILRHNGVPLGKADFLGG